MIDLEKEIFSIQGNWLENLVIGENEIWNVDKIPPKRHKPVKNPLPSDARFREDLIWLKYGD
jgi:hypothetical protein